MEKRFGIGGVIVMSFYRQENTPLELISGRQDLRFNLENGNINWDVMSIPGVGLLVCGYLMQFVRTHAGSSALCVSLLKLSTISLV